MMIDTTLDHLVAQYAGRGRGGYRVACPLCAKRLTDKSLGITVGCDGVVWHCFRCGAAGSWHNDKKCNRPGSQVSLTKPSQNVTLASNWLSVWEGLAAISGTAQAYLQARGCAVPPADGDLRCTESMRHPSGHIGPALVACVTDTITGEPITLHRTWIKADGTKADVDPPRLLLGKHRKEGGAIRLWPNEAVTVSLGVAEGIETALTLATVHKPVWSLIDAGNLANFPALAGIESLLIAADNDLAGLRAADECASQWHLAGREVRIAQSPVRGEDLNDYARRAA